MFFLFAILHIVPPLIAVIIYERLRGYKIPNIRRAALYLIFAFFITVAGVAALWALGMGYQVWIPDNYGVVTDLKYILAFAAVSFATAVIIPHTICLVLAKASAEEKESSDEKDAADTSGQEVGK